MTMTKQEQIDSLTDATTIHRYHDAADLGSIDLTEAQAAAIYAAAQWPEGLLRLARLRSICDDAALGGEADGDTTVYLD